MMEKEKLEENLEQQHQSSSVEETRKSPGKRSLSLTDEETDRGRKRSKVVSGEEGAQKQARKRTSENEETDRGRKRAKVVSGEERTQNQTLKRSRTSENEETDRGRKRAKVISGDERTQKQTLKRSRTSENEEEQGMLKRAKTSSSGKQLPQRQGSTYDTDERDEQQLSSSKNCGMKRCRTSDGEEEESRKKKRTSSEQQEKEEPAAQAGPSKDFPAGGSQQHLKPKKPLGQSLADYQFHRVLGQGGFGKVMLASLKNKEQLVAVKVINKVMDKSYLVLTEKNVLQIAGGSPFLCRGLAAFQTQEHCYLVMEYLRGGSLESYMNRKGGVGTRITRSLAAEMICGTQYLHAGAIIHRDLKPENILLDHDGHIRIADFGIAEENIIGEEKTPLRAGTLHYMAPEVISSTPYGATADWWSLGVILYGMLTGQHPFNKGLDRMEYIREVLYTIPSYPDWLPSDAVDLLNRLLDKNAETRLGVNGNIRDHPFFESINWEQIERYRAAPPSLPSTSQDTETGTDEQDYSFMGDDSSATEDSIIHGLSFVIPEWRE